MSDAWHGNRKEHRTMSRITATIMCEHCAWRAKHTADTPMEAAEFLSLLLLS